jgi:putative ABC transport system ATP-binding protein
VSFTVPAGQFVSITGASGCGKSTLLNLLAGLDEPTSGRVTIGGQDLATLSADARSDLRLRRIGFVFQDWNLLPTFTAFENVTAPLEFLRVGWREAKRRAAAVLDAARVPAGAHHRLPADLSGGEQQRTAIARALVTEPQLLLADEPTGNLDTVTGAEILSLVHDLHSRLGMTVLMVTHDSKVAESCPRTITLRDGRITGDLRRGPAA